MTLDEFFRVFPGVWLLIFAIALALLVWCFAVMAAIEFVRRRLLHMTD